jgi:hypothetical protein
MTVSTLAAAGPSAADLHAIQNFKLTPQFLHNYEAYEEEATQRPCELSTLIALQKAADSSQSLDQTIAAFDAQPGVHAALKRNRLTAREMILGMTVLTSAAVEEIRAQHPEMAAKGEIRSETSVSPDNMAFYRQHKDELRRHQLERARAQLKRSGGKLPDCLKSNE